MLPIAGFASYVDITNGFLDGLDVASVGKRGSSVDVYVITVIFPIQSVTI